MGKALLPSGTQIYANEKQRVSVSLPDKGSARRIEKGIRKRLKSDPRYLRIDIQCEPDRPCWQARILWGDAKECLEHPRLIFGAGEQTAKVVVGRISEELDRLGLSPVQPQYLKHPWLER